MAITAREKMLELSDLENVPAREHFLSLKKYRIYDETKVEIINEINTHIEENNYIVLLEEEED